jgi:glyoxylase-like metal-dependent hydrolase (beta-lactamase superfamily II)
MKRAWIIAIALAGLVSQHAAAQDARTVLASASKALGADNLTSITYYGQGANFNLGQSNNANGAWPRINLDDFRRSIDFSAPATRATAQTFAAPVQGGPAVVGQFQQNVTPANTAWAQQLEIWTTPWGFVKGAAANSATTKSETVSGTRYNVVTWMTTQKAPSGVSYRVVGYINAQTNLVDRVDTWIENPIFGDMLVENDFTQYREAQNGLKFPSTMVQKRGGWPTFEAQLLGAVANPANIQALLTPPPPAGGRGAGPGGPGGPGAAPPPPAAVAEKLADGVYRMTGGYNALAIEFADHIFIWEGGAQNEARTQAVFAEAKRVIPNKPIRYAAISHHHFDHTSGLPATVAEGVTIVMHENNKAFFEKALGAPRTLAPDAMTKSGKKPVIEGIGDKRVFQDATRTVELHLIKGLPHADGMLVAYLPKEKILAYADTYNAPAAGQTAPTIVAVEVMVANLERLGLDYDRLVSAHAPNPDRPITKTEVLASLGR